MIRQVVLSFAAFSLLLLGGVAQPAWAGEWLVTAEEVARAAAPEGQMFQPVSAVTGSGPEIVVKTPRALERIAPPVDILVTFEPGKSGLRPDMSTFKATLIGFIDIDLTDRVRKYLKDNRLDVQDASLPSGNHRIRLSIRDTDDNINERDLKVQIVSKD